MEPDARDRVEALCLEALSRDGADRTAFLDAACGSDRALRREVESLLEGRSAAAPFLERPAFGSRPVAPGIAPGPHPPGSLLELAGSGQEMSLAPGARLGPYEIQSLIGAGGMGEVYRARDARLERDVALKVLPAETLADPTARARLLREARLASKLNHPNVCTVYEVGEAEGRTFIAMELIEGQPLSVRLAEGPLPVEQVLRYGRQLADALAHAHERGVVHRDLKSNNVSVTPEGRVKVLDFGLAKRLASEAAPDATTLSRQASLTEAGTIVGTLAYMAPEQLRGEGADARSDVWALGVMLHEMAAGARPFRGTTGYDLSAAILNQAPPPLPSSVPAPLAAVVVRCLAKEPGQRYQRGGEVRAALEAAASGEKLPMWPALRAWVARHRAQAALAVLVAVLAGVAALDIGGVRGRLLGRAGGARAIRMAVLPFENLSHDPEKEYLSDGLTQELTGELGRLHPRRLQVIAWTSMKRYKNTTTPVGQLARDLNGLDYVLAGSAQPEGSRVRVALELIAVGDQSQVWRNRYDSSNSDLLLMESDVARNVARELALELLPAEQGRLAAARQVNGEAHDLYLKGFERWHSLTPGDLDASLKYFERALEMDQGYAPAHAGVALVWAGRSQMGITPPGEAGPKARAAALKAIQLDDTNMEAHYALAIIKAWTDWDWAGAEAAFKRAIALNPNFPDARAYYSHYLNNMGRPTEAMPEIERAAALDPYNPLFQALYAVDLVYARRYDEAIEQSRRALSTQPDLNPALNAIWSAFSLKGMHKEALAAAKAYMNVVYGDRATADAFDRGYEQGGYAEAMRRAAQALAARGRASYVSPYDIAQTHLEAGDNAQALDWFEKALAVHEPSLPYLGTPQFDRLRAEPRFQALLRKIGLPRG